MTATVIYPIIGEACCWRCGRPISRETRIALAIKTRERGDWLDRGDELCAECAEDQVTTETEFSAYLAEGGFGAFQPVGESPIETINRERQALIERVWGDPTSPCA